MLGGHLPPSEEERLEGERGPSSESQDLEPIKDARLLLVEDNQLNQQVAMELLTGAGFVVDLAENGEVAVQRVGETPYDLVLMDMQMPVMDGVTATGETRKDTGFADLPIVAMTASVMAGDREKCLGAGMNDHVAKPIDPDSLFATLVKWIPPGEREAPAPALVVEAVDAPAGEEVGPSALEGVEGLDVEAGVKRVIGKRDFYEKLVRGFVEGEEAEAVASVRALLAEGERASAERVAHSLKGVAGTIGASELQARAQSLEEAIKEGQEEDAIESRLVLVDEELTRLVTAVREALGLKEGADEEGTEEEDEPLNLDAEVIEKLPELIEQLEAKKDAWEGLRETLTINEIEVFANEVRALGGEYGYPPVERWGKKLVDQAEMFDLDAMSKTLAIFPEMIQQVQPH